ncbi:9751_t:CDS:10 [Funneliformis mosseae]|uniref:9751_t:CDS:1 n=1 Tax=Funneliformis mosseae TaxID=27381 RepID=A0A9N9AP65_FUNMO|nr:9751_t:CDS:10 [Funneliformis mosseae]
MNLAYIQQHTTSNSIKERDRVQQNKINDESALKKFGRITKVDKTKFRQAFKILSGLKSALASTKSTTSSLEKCLKSKNSISSDNTLLSMDDHIVNDIMDIHDVNEIHICSPNVENSLNITQEEPLELVLSKSKDQESPPQQEHVNPTREVQENHSKQYQVIQLDNHYNSIDSDNESLRIISQILPRFTLKLSDDLKEDFQPDLPISTSIENTDIIVYDSADPDFDDDDSIITVVEHKQNMTTRRKISMNRVTDGLFSSISQNDLPISSLSRQTSANNQISNEYNNSNAHIIDIDSEDDESSKKQITKQNIRSDHHKPQSNTLIDNTEYSFTSLRNVPKVQEDQNITRDDTKNHEDIKSLTSEKVPVINNRKDQSTNFLTANKESTIDSINKQNVRKRQNSHSVNKMKLDATSPTGSKLKEGQSIYNSRVSVEPQDKSKVRENKSNTSIVIKKVSVAVEPQIPKDQSVTVIEKEVGVEFSNTSKVQISNSSNPSVGVESTKDNISRSSNLTSAKDISNKVKRIPRTKALSSNKNMPNQRAKSAVKENSKNDNKNKFVASATSAPLPSISNSSVSEVVPVKNPTKRPASDETSGDILGPILEMLDNRKKLKKFDAESVVKKNEILATQNQSMIDNNIPNLTDEQSNSRAETNALLSIPLNLPYSSMSAEEHREFLQIDSMPELVSKEQQDFYKMMLERVKNERMNFEQWQFKRSKLLLGHLNKLIQSQVENHLKYGRRSNINDYPIVELTIGLNPASPEGPELKFKQRLGSIGRCFEFSNSSINQIPISLDKKLWLDDIQSVNTMTTGSKSIEIKDYWQKTKTPVVSQDPLIPEILSNHKVDIVISSGGLVALIGLVESIDDEMEIPIKIIETAKENSVLKTIYIDKPFVKKQFTPREINQIYYNTAFEKYSLWDIGELSILVRCRSSGYSNEPDKKIRTVGIKTKLEYQLDYNFESITNVERARWWIYSLIRDKADLMLGRINVPTNTLYVIEKASTEQILPDEARMKLLNKRLHYIFKHLQCSLSKGSYLLHHEKKEPYVTIYKSVENAENSCPLQPLINSQEINLQSIKIDRDTIPFVPLLWKGSQAQVAAASLGNVEVVKILINDNANVESCNRENITSLIIATYNGHADAAKVLLAREMCRLLLEHDANRSLRR